MFLKKYWKSFLFGLLSGLAFPPTYLFIFVPITVFYLLTKLYSVSELNKNSSLIQSFAYGLVFGFGYFLTQLYWVSFSLLVDIKTYLWLLPFAIVIIPLICALYFAFSTLATVFTIKKLNIKNKFLITLIFSLFFTVGEYLRSFIFPWSVFSYILGFSDILIQISYILNIYILDFILIFLFSFLFVFIEYKDKKIVLLKTNKYYSIIYILLAVFIFFYGITRLSNVNIKKLNKTFRIVQVNIPQTLKWDPQESQNIINKYINMTTQSDLNNIDIIIWAESSIPYLMTQYSKLNQNFEQLNEKILITGAIRASIKNREIEELWNSIFIFKNGNILDYYDKNILVPFGEYIPFSKYLPFIKKLTNGNIEFSKGNGNKTININNIKISPIICYEIVFPQNVIDKKNPPDLIVNLTNDGWFGNSSGPYQHLNIAKFRAVENKIPIIRVSNSGISAYIDEYGRIQQKIPLDISKTLDISI